MRHRVLYDGLYTFAMRLLNMACAAGLGILTARVLGPHGKGLYAVPSVEAGLIAAGFTGLGSATSFFLLNRSPGARVLRPALACCGLFVVAGAALLVPIGLFSPQRWALLPAIASLPSAAAVNLVMGYATGVKRIRNATTISVTLTAVTLALVAAGLFIIARSPFVAVAAWVVSNAIVAVAALGWLFWDSRRLRGEEYIGTGEFARFAIKVGFVNLVALLNYRADLYIVALLTSPSVLGMYTVAVSAAESLLVPTQVTALVTSPHIGSLERSAAAALTARCVRNNLIIALAVCGVLFAFAAPVVRLLYGSAFLAMVPALQILLVGVFALSLGSPMSTYFTLKLGKPEVPLTLASISAAICIALSFALIPRTGMIGAAVASTAAYVAGQALAIWYFGRNAKLGFDQMLVPTAEDLRTYLAFALRVYADGKRLLGFPVAPSQPH